LSAGLPKHGRSLAQARAEERVSTDGSMGKHGIPDVLILK